MYLLVWNYAFLQATVPKNLESHQNICISFEWVGERHVFFYYAVPYFVIYVSEVFLCVFKDIVEEFLKTLKKSLSWNHCH